MSALSLYTIYDSPSDYPGVYVVREWVLERPGPVVGTAKTLEEARSLVPRQADHNLGRFKADDAVIVETWV